jgi:putative membrane protein
MKPILTAAAAAFLLAGCAARDMEPPVGAAMAGAPTMLSEASRHYAMMTASANMLEVEKSRVALQRANSPVVRQFAQMMIDDHGRMLREAEPVMRSLGIDPMQLGMAPQHRALLQRVQNAPAADFDRVYHEVQVNAHQESLMLQRGYAANGDNPQLRALAMQAVPVIERHLAHLSQHGQHMTQQPMQQPQPAATRRAGERG